MSGYAVSIAALEGLVDRMAAFDREAAGRLVLTEDALRTAAATWRGEAAASCAAAHREWVRDLDTLRAAALRLRATVATAQANYAAAAAANGRMWSP